MRSMWFICHSVGLLAGVLQKQSVDFIETGQSTNLTETGQSAAELWPSLSYGQKLFLKRRLSAI